MSTCDCELRTCRKTSSGTTNSGTRSPTMAMSTVRYKRAWTVYHRPASSPSNFSRNACQSQMTPGLWKHDTCPISFSLVVDDFGVKYVGKENAQHLVNTVRGYYKCSCNWEGERYCGLTIKWDYVGQKVHLSMPGYVRKGKALTRFHPPPPDKTTGSTLVPPCQTKLWGEKEIRTRG